VYLVFASLIVPALAVRGLERRGLALGYMLGALGYGAGLLLSALSDLPSGPVIVWTLVMLAIPVFLVGGMQGITIQTTSRPTSVAPATRSKEGTH
jgi:zinc/manganese transport system permease protein